MDYETLPTTPKPFVFVLMPFKEDFDDIYKLGIKEAAKEVGAYAERVDEQDFSEGILERIFNQINKADVIVADMTGRNPNVFYEVGYAHALGKIVLLLTQNGDDIPFDLKNKQHIIYGDTGGKIQSLRNELKPKLNWAINESKRGKKEDDSIILVSISSEWQPNQFTEIPEDCLSKPIPIIRYQSEIFTVNSLYTFNLYNNSSQEIQRITHIYLFTDNSDYSSFYASDESIKLVYDPNKDEKFPLKFQLPIPVLSIPAGAVESFDIYLSKRTVVINYKLRIHISNNYYDFSFQI
jgi:hypothetical protein